MLFCGCLLDCIGRPAYQDSARNFTPHVAHDKDMHERRSGKKATFRHDYTHLGENEIKCLKLAAIRTVCVKFNPPLCCAMASCCVRICVPEYTVCPFREYAFEYCKCYLIVNSSVVACVWHDNLFSSKEQQQPLFYSDYMGQPALAGTSS